jgi:HK97 family phage major capsid protein
MTLEERKNALTAALKSARDIAGQAEDAGRDLTGDERSQVMKHLATAKEHRDVISAKESDSDLRKQIADFGDGIGLEEKSGRASGPQRAKNGLLIPDRKHSPGQLFVGSQSYADMIKRAPNGQFMKDQRVSSDPVGFKTLITGGDPSGSAGTLVEPDQLGIQVGADALQRQLTLRNLVTAGTTGTDSVDYVRITGFANNAAPVPEATTTAAVGSGSPVVTAAQAGVKPESGFSTQRVQTPVKTIATWMPATKRALSDAGQIAAIIDGFLEYFLEEELEDQMVRGDGLGENFEGLASVSGTQTQTAVTDPTGAPEGLGLLLGMRRAKTKVRTVGKSQANGYAIHPNDLERLEELVDNDGRFYGDGPFGGAVTTTGGGTPVIWGIPAIECEGVVEGAPWCADWRKSILWDREQSSITATDSHMDFFVRNLVAILAEMRAAYGVVQPSAFCKVLLPA